MPVADRRRRRDGGVAVGAGRAPGAARRAAARRPPPPRRPGHAQRRAVVRAAARARRRPRPRRSTDLQQALALPALPRRIECIDISTLQGSETVASLVVCEDGRMAKGEYRKYRVSGPGPGLGKSACQRRCRTCTMVRAEPPPSPSPEPRAPSPEPRAPVLGRLRRHGAGGAPALSRGWSRPAGRFPTCWSSTAARASSAAAYAALERVGLVESGGGRPGQEGGAGLHARRRRADGASTAPAPALRLLQRIRDEAHRFAVTFHRTSRRKRDFTLRARRHSRRRARGGATSC